MMLAAEVGEVFYVDDDIEGLWSLKCRVLTDSNNINFDDFPISARPIDATFKQPPIPGEIILIMPQASNLSSRSAPVPEYYYLQTLNIQSSINSNRLPGVTAVEASSKGGSTDTSNTGNATNGATDDKDTDFNESSDVRPLQVYEGDTLIEGRFGQSIRLGSTITKKGANGDKYTLGTPQWLKGDGVHGDAITVIRNGQKPDAGFKSKPEPNKFILESIDYDASSIYMTSTQEVAVTKATPDNVASDFIGMEQNTYKGEQVILAADRLIFNARNKEIFMWSGGGIGLASHKGISLDSSGGGINIAGKVINLGSEAETKGEPAVLGDNLQEMCIALFDILGATLQTLTTHVHGYPGTTPSPDGAPAWGNDIADLEALRVEYGFTNDATWKSKHVFVNKDSDYSSEASADKLKPN